MIQLVRIKRIKIVIVFLILNYFVCFGQDLKVTIEPVHNDWSYKLGENANFKVSVSGNLDQQFTVTYSSGPEKMAITKIDSFRTTKSNFIIDGGTMNTPGFLRCNVTVAQDNYQITEYATAAFQPEDINPTIPYPDDFIQFWENTISEAREIPLDAKFTLIEEKSTDDFNVYEISYLNYEYKNRSYGILTIPTRMGKYPAIIRFPGAGVHPLGGNIDIAEKNVITLDIYIHPFSMLLKKEFYDHLKDSPYIDYKFWGSSNRDSFYYKRVITGCVKAVDFIYTLEQFDGENLASWGSSQGGALSIITTSLDKRIKMLVVLCPAMCDYTGYLYNRAGGWPHFFNEENIEKYNNEDVLGTLPYYDVVNFARNITVPGFYSWGFNDETTPPTSFYSAYNVIDAPKKVLIILEGKHRIYPTQRIKSNEWILGSFLDN